MHNTDKNKLRVVMSGPLPPAIGGMATVINDMSNSTLSERIDLILFNTAKTTPEGRSFWIGLKSRLQLCKRWWSELQGDKSCIAHIHTCSGFTFFLDGILLILARVKNVQVILHIHGARFDSFLDDLGYVSLTIARWLSRRAARVIVLSESWREKLLEKLPGTQFCIVENCVPVPSINMDDNDDKVITILFLGNLCQRKGVWDLLEVAKTLPTQSKIVFVGGEEDIGIGDKITKKIMHEGLEEKVSWEGPVYGDSKYDWYKKGNIFVLPSYAEGLPISLLEAMCSGLPVVVTPVGGIPKVVKHNKTGLLVQPGDIKGLSNALSQLINDREMRVLLGAEAKKHCANEYGIETCVRKYLDIYTQINPDF